MPFWPRGFKTQTGLFYWWLKGVSRSGQVPPIFHALLFLSFMYLLPRLSLQKAAFQDANVCLFVFDCIYFNDVSLMDR